MEDDGGADIHLQPVEDPTPEQGTSPQRERAPPSRLLPSAPVLLPARKAGSQVRSSLLLSPAGPLKACGVGPEVRSPGMMKRKLSVVSSTLYRSVKPFMEASSEVEEYLYNRQRKMVKNVGTNPFSLFSEELEHFVSPT
ncbi:hypothetical protein GRJ2_001087400 [Grus japonensis]|uniref:Uncharacterized protein n=1 Tax=Grus japonensis TaxID=30415 RepID=A0ABC9WL71_GRUJA